MSFPSPAGCLFLTFSVSYLTEEKEEEAEGAQKLLILIPFIIQTPKATLPKSPSLSHWGAHSVPSLVYNPVSFPYWDISQIQGTEPHLDNSMCLVILLKCNWFLGNTGSNWLSFELLVSFKQHFFNIKFNHLFPIWGHYSVNFSVSLPSKLVLVSSRPSITATCCHLFKPILSFSICFVAIFFLNV